MEDAELGFCRQVADVRHLQAVTEIGFVASKPRHGVGVGQALERSLNLELRRQIADQTGVQAFNQAEDILFLDKAHFQVELGELRLPVGAQVFVTEAAGNLEITFHTADHQQLLQLLWGLGQRVKIARMGPAGNQVVACSFRRAFDQDRRFDLQETVTVEIVPDVFHCLVTQPQVVLHLWPSEVKIAVAQTQAFVRVNVVRDVERRRERLVQNRQPFHHYLHLTGGQSRVFRAFRSESNGAGDFNAPFGSQPFSGLVVFCRQVFRIEHHLHVSGAVPQVDEYDAAVIPAPANPAGQRREGAIVGGAQSAAVLGLQSVNSWQDW